MLEILGIVIFLGLVGASIGLHEFGHFIPAKKFGVKVSEFAIGFGPTLFSRNFGETSFRLRLLPVGGFIRMIGMYLPARPSGKPDVGFFSSAIESARAEAANEITLADESRTFTKLSVPKRLVIMTGGPVMNLFLSVIMFTVVLSVVGFQSPTSTIGEVIQCVPSESNPNGLKTNGICKDSVATPASQSELKPGDKIVEFAGVQVNEWADFSQALSKFEVNDQIQIKIIRANQTLTINTALAELRYPEVDAEGNETGKFLTRPFVGLSPEFSWQTLPVTQVPKYMWDFTTSTIESLMSFPVRVYDLAYRLATGKERDPNGPISVVGVTRLSGEIAASDQSLRAKVQQIVGMAASLNLFLFLFNLLPFLPLDGGHVAGAIFESLRRRFAKLRGRPDPGPVDIARMLPVTYLVSLLLLATGLIVIVADTIAPISLNS
ncbi:MAG: hypothetical protein RLZZ508_1102 [Actinomycetota bacterium]